MPPLIYFIEFELIVNMAGIDSGSFLFYNLRMKKVGMKSIFKGLLLVSIIISLSFGFIRDSTGVPMRDGINLGTDLYYPVTYFPPWPTLLQRTPYDRGWDSLEIFLITDVLGYVLVVQNLRGYGDSEGEPMVFLTDGWGNLQDGYDAIEWIASRWWSNDEIGMIGASAHGMTQYYAAGAVPPHLVCCAPMVAGPSIYHHVAFTGGEFRKALVETWLTGVGTPWLIDTVCRYPNYGPKWSVVNLTTRWNVAHYPMFHIDGWYDMYTDGVLEAFSELQKRYHNQKLFIGPWGHGDAWGSRYQGDLVYPPNAEMSELEFFNMLLDWYNYWMQDSSGIILTPRVKFYLMGDCDTQDTTYWNHWVEADTWPLPNVQLKTYYIRENGLLDTIAPTQISAVDTFQYNPVYPCSSYGGREFIGLPYGYGPKNQNPIENRPDVLVYTTPIFNTPLTVIGKLKFVLYAASNCYDTDWTIRVTDVYPDGRSILVTDNILMARHRHGFDREDSLIPGVPDTFLIDLWSTAQVFNTGHRLRVIISSSNYPRFEKNPNTGAPFKRNDSVTVVATQSIYRSSIMPSHLLLPVLPGQSPFVQDKYHYEYAKCSAKISIPTIASSPEICFELNKVGCVKISLYDVMGRNLWSFDNPHCPVGNSNLRLPQLASGIYFVHVRIEEEESIHKIIVVQ